MALPALFSSSFLLDFGRLFYDPDCDCAGLGVDRAHCIVVRGNEVGDVDVRFEHARLLRVAEVVDGQEDVLVGLLALHWVVLLADEERLFIGRQRDVGDLLHVVRQSEESHRPRLVDQAGF